MEREKYRSIIQRLQHEHDCTVQALKRQIEGMRIQETRSQAQLSNRTQELTELQKVLKEELDKERALTKALKKENTTIAKQCAELKKQVETHQTQFAYQATQHQEAMKQLKTELNEHVAETLALKKRASRAEIELKALGRSTTVFPQPDPDPPDAEESTISITSDECRMLVAESKENLRDVIERLQQKIKSQKQHLEQVAFEKQQLETTVQSLFVENEQVVQKCMDVEKRMEQFERERADFRTLQNSYQVTLDEKQRHLESTFQLLQTKENRVQYLQSLLDNQNCK